MSAGGGALGGTAVAANVNAMSCLVISSLVRLASSCSPRPTCSTMRSVRLLMRLSKPSCFGCVGGANACIIAVAAAAALGSLLAAAVIAAGAAVASPLACSVFLPVRPARIRAACSWAPASFLSSPLQLRLRGDLPLAGMGRE